MRKADKKITDRRVIESLLKSCPVGRLGTIGKDGYPMIKPLNYAYHGGKVYFHSALAGEKIDDIARDSRVCFEVDLPIAFVRAKSQPCEAEYLYRSVIIRGRASLVRDPDERTAAFKYLMEKYQPEGGYGAYLPDKLAITGIVGIDIEEMVGKEDLGKGALKEKALAALERDVHLPIVLER